jgi:predicted transcriptional regulator
MDPDFTLVKNWGLTESGPNVVLLDKNGVCRYIYKGKKVPASEFPKIINMVKGLI